MQLQLCWLPNQKQLVQWTCPNWTQYRPQPCCNRNLRTKLRKWRVRAEIQDILRLDTYHDNPSESAIRWDNNCCLRRLRHFLSKFKIKFGQCTCFSVVVVQIAILRRLSATFCWHQLNSILRWHLPKNPLSTSFLFILEIGKRNHEIYRTWFDVSKLIWLRRR